MHNKTTTWSADAQRVLQLGCLSLEGADLTLTEAKVDDKQRSVEHSTTGLMFTTTWTDLHIVGWEYYKFNWKCFSMFTFEWNVNNEWTSKHIKAVLACV